MSTKGWLRAIPGSAIASKALEVVKGWQNDAVYKVLTRAMLEDKNYAKILASKATEKTIAKAIEPFLYAGVDVARREAPRIGQAVAQTSTTQTKPRRTQSRPLQQSQGARSEIQSHTERSSSLNDAPPPATTQGVKRTSVDVAKLPPFIRAVIETESAGNPNARSPKGARGLMQIMPEHYERLGITDPEDPAESVRAGTRILEEEMQRFQEPRLALAAYNAGSPKVIKAIARAGSSDFNRVYPFLPTETQAYVAKVLRKYHSFTQKA